MIEQIGKFLAEYKGDIIFIALAVFAYALLSTRATATSTTEFDNLIGNEETTVLYFYSNRCPQCLVAKPIVESIEGELADEATFLKINVFDEVGRQAVRRFGVTATPTMVVINQCNEMVAFHQGLPGYNKIVDAARAPCDTQAAAP